MQGYCLRPFWLQEGDSSAASPSSWAPTPRGCGSIGTALLLVLFVLVPVPAASAQPEFAGTPDEAALNARVYPTDFWSPRIGPGVGVGLVGHNLARRHDQWLLTAAPARYEQAATAAFASANPRRAKRYVLFDARGLHTNRDWLGPPSGRTTLERSALHARVRGGQALLNHRLLLQPHLTVTHHRVDAVTQPVDGDAPSAFVPAPGSQHTGLHVGTDVQFDTRNRPLLATRGVRVQGTWTRYVPLDGAAPQFDQFDIDAYGYLPLGGLHRLVPRAALTLTRSRDDAPIPVYMLPTLGGTVVPGWARGRFAGLDRLMTSTLYRFPLIHYDNLATVEGHLGMHLAGVYNTLGDQFSAEVSFENDVSLDESTRPLRPTASAGIRFVMPDRPHVSLELALGASANGFTAARLSFERSLQALRSSHHSPTPLR